MQFIEEQQKIYHEDRGLSSMIVSTTAKAGKVTLRLEEFERKRQAIRAK